MHIIVNACITTDKNNDLVFCPCYRDEFRVCCILHRNLTYEEMDFKMLVDCPLRKEDIIISPVRGGRRNEGG